MGNVAKSEDFSEWFNSVIKDAKLCDLRYNIKGFIVIMPWAMKSIERIYSLYCAELEKYSHEPAFFPSLVHEKSFSAEKEHVEGFIPEVFWVTEVGTAKLEERYALKPTGEACIYPMYSLWINGIADLPLKIYQRGWVWRHETKATKPFIRGREFLWIEAHNVFADKAAMEKQMPEDFAIAKSVIWERLGVPFIFLRRPQWDKFAGAVDTFAMDTLMPDGKVLQIGSTHLLGTNFSKAYNITYTDSTNKPSSAWQTCYGPGINRIYAAMFSVHGDDKGLVLPIDVAPTQVVIVPIIKKGSEKEVNGAAEDLRTALSAKFRVQADLSDQTPGFKYNKWEQLGVPIRVEIGMRDIASGSAVIVARDTGAKRSVPLDKIAHEIEHEGKEMQKRMMEKSSAFLTCSLELAHNFDEAVKMVSAGKMVAMPFCSEGMDGAECAKKLKEGSSCDARGVAVNHAGCKLPDTHSLEGKKCIVCGKKANVTMWLSRQY
jgi:prolyl-tRNA synthetase